MNEHLSVGDRFFRDIDEFENAPPDCRQTPDGCALDAYLCPSGQWTIGDGCCFWEDGTPVKKGDTLPDGPELAARRKSLLAYNAKYCEEYVRRYVTVPLTQNQFDMLCAFRFNTRETTLRNSSRLLPAVNAQEWQKAASAFTEFVYGSSKLPGPEKLPPAGWAMRRVGDQFWAYPPATVQADAVPLGIKSCDYQEALRGLLRRRLWQGLVFLDHDPEEAVKDKDVALPTDRKFLNSGVWRDVVRSEGVTTLNQVKMNAAPLAQAELVLTQPAPPIAVRVPEADGGAAGGVPSPTPAVTPPPVSPAPSVSVVPPASAAKKPEVVASPPAAAPRAPVPAPLPKPAQPPVVAGQDGTKPKSPWTVQPEDVYYKIDPTAGLKPLETSDRAKAFYWQRTFLFIIFLGGAGVLGKGFLTVAEVLMKHPALMSVVLDLIVPMAMAIGTMLFGVVGKSWADWKRHQAQRVASQALY